MRRGNVTRMAPRAVIRHVRDGQITYDMIWLWCPGCDEAHAVPVTGPNAWRFDGNVESPTLSPSLLCKGVRRCHSFVREGSWQFLTDCEHGLAGKTVPLPPLPDWLLE